MRRVPADLLDLVRQRAEHLEAGLEELQNVVAGFCDAPSTTAGRAVVRQGAACREVAQELADKCRTVAEMIGNYIDNRSAEWWDRSHNVEIYEEWRDTWDGVAEEAVLVVRILDDVAKSAPHPALDDPSASKALHLLDGLPFVGGTGALVRWVAEHVETEDNTPIVDDEELASGHWTVEHLQTYFFELEPLRLILDCIADDDNIAPFV